MKLTRETNMRIAVGIGGVLLLLVGYLVYVNVSNSKISKVVDCLNEKEAVMYGAAWCKHCNEEKELFGESFRRLTYIECSSVEGDEMLKTCVDQKIERYPTWVFGDGTRIEGVYKPESLAVAAKCEM